MELLKQKERLKNFDGKDLKKYLYDLTGQIEKMYDNTTKRVNFCTSLLNSGDGISDTFTTVDGKTVTVVNGIVTDIS